MFNYCYKCSGKLIKKGPREYCCLKCGKTLFVNPAPGSSLMILDNLGRILLVKRGRPPKKGFWDIPGGFFEFNETAENGLVREIKEELGIEIKSWNYYCSQPDTYRYKGIIYETLSLFFLCRVSGREDFRVGGDVKEIGWFFSRDIPYEKIAFASTAQVLKGFRDFGPNSRLRRSVLI